MSDVVDVTPRLLRSRPLPRHVPGDDKEGRGRVLVIGGSVENPGAALLAGTAALRAGAGKLQIATCESVARQLAVAIPEARVFGLPETDQGGIAPEAVETLRPLLGECAAAVLGPGMIDEAATMALCAAVLDCDLPALVIDAGALKRLGERSEALASRRGRTVLAPHAGEMAGCLGVTLEEVEADPLALARRAAAELHAVTALKGACTHIAAPDGQAWLSDHGCIGLATSGSGDTLAGVIGGLLARGAEPETAAVWGVWMHGEAGLRLERSRGPLGFLARELPGEIPAIMAELRPMSLSDADQALLDLLRALAQRDYAFVTPTPATHARVVARLERQCATDVRDVFGWSLPFDPDGLEPEIRTLLDRADGLETTPQGLKSRIRVSSLADTLFLHSAYPTEAEDAVFFGPDSYRFADFITAELAGVSPGARIVDIGTGSGVGAIMAGRGVATARLLMTDVNSKALRLARINAAFAGVVADTQQADGLEAVGGEWDVVLANPPYIADAAGRDYRDGGGMHGAGLSLELASAAAERLAPGGRLLLYTGAAIVGGRDALREALTQAMSERGCSLEYRELDPDVFGEELEKPAYADVERIAVVGAVAAKTGLSSTGRP